MDELNLSVVLPEMVLLALLCVVLIMDLFVKSRQTTYISSIAVLAVTACFSLNLIDRQAERALSGMFVSDPMSSIAKVAILLSVSLSLIYTRKFIENNGMFKGEYYTLNLFSALGMMIMVSASSFVALYMGLELMSLALYALAALKRDDSRALEASMKYFVLGALASGILLYGMSMIYGATGSLDIAYIATSLIDAKSQLANFGLVFIVCGLAFKLGAVPFHMWIPDVYQGSPTAVTLIIGTAPKIAAVVFVFRFLLQGLESLMYQWQDMLIILAVLSLVIGNVVAIAQSNLKRMLAYSTMSHMGFILLGILSGSKEGYGASFYYSMAYVLTTLASFGMLMLLSPRGFNCENLDDLRGLNKANSLYAFLVLLIMFSMAGIPPLIGFWAKLAILQALVNVGLNWLAVLAVMASLIGAFYYIRVIKAIYFDQGEGQSFEQDIPSSWALTLNSLSLLALGIVPQFLISLSTNSVINSL